MTATDGFILRHTPILGCAAVAWHLSEICFYVRISPACFSLQAPSCRSHAGQEGVGSPLQPTGQPGVLSTIRAECSIHLQLHTVQLSSLGRAFSSPKSSTWIRNTQQKPLSVSLHPNKRSPDVIGTQGWLLKSTALTQPLQLHGLKHLSAHQQR